MQPAISRTHTKGSPHIHTNTQTYTHTHIQRYIEKGTDRRAEKLLIRDCVSVEKNLKPHVPHASIHTHRCVYVRKIRVKIDDLTDVLGAAAAVTRPSCRRL
mmetsp:Transcript_14450/g.41607  ORF Transcript_14450/g.41607 Transcript_14450/m.41607 type:complete len:101 (+) Transcript_14450:294-596(+)